MPRLPLINAGKRHRFPVEIISHCVWLNFRFCLSDEVDLRRTISAATNIAEAWNGFVQWVACGSEGVTRQNNRGEQRKISRYNHFVADLVVFHNVVSMTQVLQGVIDEGYPVTPKVIARLSPYKTAPSNRIG